MKKFALKHVMTKSLLICLNSKDLKGEILLKVLKHVWNGKFLKTDNFQLLMKIFIVQIP